jgi:hypothetical protein
MGGIRDSCNADDPFHSQAVRCSIIKAAACALSASFVDTHHAWSNEFSELQTAKAKAKATTTTMKQKGNDSLTTRDFYDNEQQSAAEQETGVRVVPATSRQRL